MTDSVRVLVSIVCGAALGVAALACLAWRFHGG